MLPSTVKFLLGNLWGPFTQSIFWVLQRAKRLGRVEGIGTAKCKNINANTKPAPSALGTPDYVYPLSLLFGGLGKKSTLSVN